MIIPNKCSYVFSTDSTRVNNVSPISITNCAVQRIEYANKVGVTISSNLTWNAHVECIVSKDGKRVFIRAAD